MDRRVVVTMLVMMAFFMAVSYVYPLIFPPPPAPPKEVSAQGAVGPTLQGGGVAVTQPQAPQKPQSPDAEVIAEAPAPLPPAAEVVVETPEFTAVFTEEGARLKSFKLKKYKAYKMDRNEPDKPQELVNLPKGTAPGESYPLNLVFLNNQNQEEDLAHFRFQADLTNIDVKEGESATLNFTGVTGNGLSITRSYTFMAGSYQISQRVVLKNQGNLLFSGLLGMAIDSWPYSSQQNRYNVMAAYLNNSFVNDSVDDAKGELADLGIIRQASFLGYMDQYFLSAMIFDDDPSGPTAVGPDGRTLTVSGAELTSRGVRLTAYRPMSLQPAGEASYSFDVYYGPKDQKSLEAAGHQLRRSIDLGWFAFLAKPLAWLLRFFYGFVGNYGVAIILVTILIKIVLWPLTAKSYKSMKQMQKLQPKIMQLREKYKDDPPTMNKEMLQLYKTFKVSPLGGCLPMLLQIPFFIAFYRVLDYALELRGAPFALWIYDLSAPDRLFHFNFSVPFVAQPTGIPVLTLLMGATMIWQQKMTPAMGDPMQAKIMMLLPIIFIVALLNMPAGLVLYWLVNNILSIFQQKLINRPEKEEAPKAL
ncbi:MAG: membrane protein insertase YidC [Deltaproteobacteria bacterium]|jgi:YidC/Oxa1 family membrane protein insertase|nr:membrane protein insertase YidC [Deltaproteobacteria bacterium]